MNKLLSLLLAVALPVAASAQTIFSGGIKTPTVNGNTVPTGAGSVVTSLDVGTVPDSVLASSVKPAVALVSVVNLTLSGEQTIDGMTTSNSLVLATAQTTGSQNGPWVSGTGAWTRPTWYSNGSTTQAPQFLTTFVRRGTTYQGSTWRMVTGPVTIGTTATVWELTPTNVNSVVGKLPVANLPSGYLNDLSALPNYDPEVPGQGYVNAGVVMRSISSDADATAWAAAVTAAGGSYTATQLAAVNRFAAAAKGHAYWTNLLDVGVLTGNDLTSARIKLKTYGSTGSSLTNQGFVTGDYNAALGLTANGAKGLLNNFPWATYGTNILGLSFFENDEQVPSGAYAGVWAGRDAGGYGTPYAQIFGAVSTGRVVNQGGYSGTVGPLLLSSNQYALGKGLTHLVRASNTSASLYFNGAKVATSTTAVTDSTQPNTTPSVIFAGGNNGYHGFAGVGSFYAYDDGQMGDAKAALFGADVLALQAGLGRFVPATYAVRFVPIVGQSLATGTNGSPALSTTQPYANRCFPSYFSGDQVASNSRPYTLVPFVETTQETIAAGATNLTSSLWRSDHAGDASRDTIIGNYATGGLNYSYIKKGGLGTNYADMIGEITSANTLAPRYGTGLIVPFVLWEHGESDAQSTTYQADITQGQSDAETDIKAITGQGGTIPALHSQPSAWTSQSSATSKSPFAIMAAYRANPTKIILVCPKYIFTYGTGADGIHLTNVGYRWLGEYYAKACDKLNRGLTWTPLAPTAISRTGATITVTMGGAVGNLVLDTTAVSNPGNYGFEWSQTGGTAQTISSVAVSGSSTVTITLSGDPGSGGTYRVRYAYTGTSGNAGGPTTGPRGNLRDSDTSVASLNGNSLNNWCCHFDDACN